MTNLPSAGRRNAARSNRTLWLASLVALTFAAQILFATSVSAHAGEHLDASALESPPPFRASEWAAVPVLREHADGTSVPSMAALHLASQGLSAAGLNEAGVPTLPWAEIGQIANSWIRENGIPLSDLEEILSRNGPVSIPASLEDGGGGASSIGGVPISVYFDRSLDSSGRNTATTAIGDVLQIYRDQVGITLDLIFFTNGQGPAGMTDVASLCDMQKYAKFEMQTGGGSAGIVIFSQDQIALPEGPAYGVAIDYPISRPMARGDSTDYCNGGIQLPLVIPSAYVGRTTVSDYAVYRVTERIVMSHHAANEVGHLFNMYHAQGDCWSEDWYHLHRTLETATSAKDVPTGCKTSNQEPIDTWNPKNHYHWSYATTGLNAIRAEKARWDGCVSAGWCAGNATPSAPLSPTAASGVRQVTISWSPPAATNSITKYQVYRSTYSGTQKAFIAEVYSGTSYEDIDPILVSGVRYYYHVRAVNSVGIGPASAEVSGVPANALSPPGAPSLNAATAGDRQVALSWSAPSSDGGSAITSYRLYRGTTSTNGALVTSGDCANLGTRLSCTDGALTNGQIYYYQVSAANGIGEGSKSNQRSATPNVPPCSGGPSNNCFVNAIASSTSPYSNSQSTSGATVESGEPLPDCQTSTGATVWYKWTAPSSGTATVSTVSGSTNFDTVLAVYTGSTLSGLSPYGCSDDFSGLQSQVSFSCTAGTTYRIQLGGYQGAQGTAALSISGCAAATNHNPTTPGLSSPADGATLTNPVTFSWSASSDQDGDTVTYVVRGAESGAPYRALCTPSPATSTSCAVTLSPTGVQYAWYVLASDGRGGSASSVTRFFTLNAGSSGPSNNNFASATTASPPEYHPSSYSTAGATTESGEPAPSCQTNFGATVWYKFTPSTSGVYQIDTTGSNYDTVVALYTGSSLTGLSQVACSDDADGLQSIVKPTLTAGTTYRIQVAGYQGAQGTLLFDVWKCPTSGVC